MKKFSFIILALLLMVNTAFATTSGKVVMTKVSSSTGISPVEEDSDISDVLGTSVSIGVPTTIIGALSATTLNAGGIYCNGTNCGIGTTSPSYNLDINGTIGNSNGDLVTNAWSDYSGSSTIVGWSLISTKLIYTKKVGKTVFVYFYIAGTSNATNATFTLPYNAASAPPDQFSANSCSDSVNSGSSSNNDYIAASNNVFNASIGKSNSGFTASGTKYIQGSFSYQSA